MKKLIFGTMALFMILAISPVKATAVKEDPKVSVTATKTTVSPEATALLVRLDEIKATDLSDMNAVQKKNLRKEERAIKSQLNDMGSGLYISAGALIVILLLVIILL